MMHLSTYISLYSWGLGKHAPNYIGEYILDPTEFNITLQRKVKGKENYGNGPSYSEKCWNTFDPNDQFSKDTITAGNGINILIFQTHFSHNFHSLLL